VYVQQDDSWKLASLSFTRLLTPEHQEARKWSAQRIQWTSPSTEALPLI